MLNVVLYQPEIPHNTGAVGRLCLATGARLHLIRPLGFSLEDKYLKRSGLDYWSEVDVTIWDDWAAFRTHVEPEAQIVFVECQGSDAYWNADFCKSDAVYLVFGPETRGIPSSIINPAPEPILVIPMKGTRSLNLATAVAIVLYEAVRQRDAE